MVLARVVGTVVSTAKAELLQGQRLLLLEKISLPSLEGKQDFVIALDAVGANAGELVFFVTGSSARLTEASKGRPTDATVAAIVDIVEHHGDLVYQKRTAGD